ncbi:hypothetical protein K493DRAFT_314493 [Basidiobolus meristosporus CBS 931.73]|uniref:Inositol phospholipid synthesis and fat-storage-inducing TM-domain-containing protein n=1 Tax=Basidiobolus meristosporus CBS 931.73 TaxID=1314790 RepID=A0A1Y1YEX4_9FUNG|nr:hypothetical protein K493DRAFT_314493 [Basidiobolus meristosporus CBS 931.73]|eukprot:ORX96483.1 hypothetical protein K493DRAFT_314493 [Basidiobolus meristosporus CBS 931.73]
MSSPSTNMDLPKPGALKGEATAAGGEEKAPVKEMQPSGPSWLRDVYLRPVPKIVLVYLGTALVGSLLHPLFHPTETYFADKRNGLNQVFVKYGWGWTSALYLLFVTFVFARGEPQKAAPFWTRWFLATSYWYVLTQWFLGPSVSDRVFTLSGGACTVPEVYDSFTCKRLGGVWAGGHDSSGHCMLLIHASLFLWEELRAGWFDANWDKRVKSKPTFVVLRLAVLGLFVLWWWMLLMTNLFFHSLPEKISGVTLGVAYWYLGYGYLFPTTAFPGIPQANLHTLDGESC